MNDKPTDPQNHLPDFQSREELAQFWDTHSFTDYLSDLEPANAHIAEEVITPLSEVTEVCFDKTTDQQLAAYANKRGMQKSTLLRIIALDWLQDQERHAS